MSRARFFDGAEDAGNRPPIRRQRPPPILGTALPAIDLTFPAGREIESDESALSGSLVTADFLVDDRLSVISPGGTTHDHIAFDRTREPVLARLNVDTIDATSIRPARPPLLAVE